MRRRGLIPVGMNKETIKRVRTINIQMVLFVFSIMLLSGLLTSASFSFLYTLGIFPEWVLSSILTPFITMLASIAIGTALTAVASERVLKPLNQLIRATKAVAKGDFRVRVQEMDSDSEIAILLRNFNHMTQELGSIEMFRNDFINNFSHEFKTPITSIMGFAKQLQNKDLSDEKRKEYTDIIINESERLTNMASNVLLLSKFENQQIITNKTQFELDEQLRNCVILLEKDWSKRNIEMHLDLEPVKISGNSEMLSHLWLNLIENAIKYSADNSSVTVSCHKAGTNVEVTVSDTGEGMDETTLKHIFDKFYQGDKSHSVTGNGLGLSIAKRIVELCNGEITVKSKLSRGTSFTVKLPSRSC